MSTKNCFQLTRRVDFNLTQPRKAKTFPLHTLARSSQYASSVPSENISEAFKTIFISIISKEWTATTLCG